MTIIPPLPWRESHCQAKINPLCLVSRAVVAHGLDWRGHAGSHVHTSLLCGVKQLPALVSADVSAASLLMQTNPSCKGEAGNYTALLLVSNKDLQRTRHCEWDERQLQQHHHQQDQHLRAIPRHVHHDAGSAEAVLGGS